MEKRCIKILLFDLHLWLHVFSFQANKTKESPLETCSPSTCIFLHQNRLNLCLHTSGVDKRCFFLLIVELCCCGRRSDRSAVFARVLVMLRKRSSLCVSTALGILLQLHFDKGQLTNRNLFCCKLLIVQNVDIVYQTALPPYPNEEELLIFQTAGNNIIIRMNSSTGSNNHVRSIDLFRSKII